MYVWYKKKKKKIIFTKNIPLQCVAFDVIPLISFSKQETTRYNFDSKFFKYYLVPFQSVKVYER